MEDIILHIYYGSRFLEVDPKKYGKAAFTLGGAGEDIPVASEGGRVVFEKDENGLSISAGWNYEIVFGGRRIEKKAVLPGDIFSVTAPGGSKSIAVVMAKKRDDYPEPDMPLSIGGKSVIRIGRGEQNDIQISDRMVSEEHAVIKKEGAGYVIEDAGSKNGTYVGGVRIKSKRLSENDVIALCGNKLTFANGTLIVANLGFGTMARGLPVAGMAGNAGRPEYPYFQRSPRLIPPMPSGDIDIPAPLAAGSQPTINWLTVLLPSMAMILVMVIIAVVTQGSSAYIALYVLMPVVSALTAVLSYRAQKKKFENETQNRESDYYRMIEAKRAEIRAAQEAQKSAMQQMSPDCREKMAIVRGRQRRMWERTAAHPDFLSFRLGIGEVPFAVNIKTPKVEGMGRPDVLMSEAMRLRSEYAMIPNAPVLLDLKKASPLGVIGQRADVIAAARSVIMDIAAHHSYDEVKTVMIFPEHETKEWESLRWLPHAFDDSRETRFIANNRRSVKSLFARLLEEIKLREMALKNSPSGDDIRLPAYVFFIGSEELVQNEPLMSWLLRPNKELGIFSVMLFDTLERLPKDCRSIVAVNNNAGKMVKYEYGQGAFIAEKATASEADMFARSMAPVRLKKLVDPYNLPPMLTFFDMYKVQKPDDLGIEKRWLSSEPYTGLIAPVGAAQNGQVQTLYIGEGARDYGLHGLVAGTIGSGKSEFLQTLILSLAANYHPHDVAFVLIDYKGGAMANAFRRLPHLAGIITNLGGNQTDRALTSIHSEIRRRQAVLDHAGVDHIHKYQRKYRNGEAKEPLPHLFVFVDEFAELKSEKPEFISGLVSAARLGRSLGVKLILATQKPAGVVDEQIKGNAGYSVCLKVQSPGDSKEMLDRPDAALINNPGRAYLRVGADTVYEMFQSAWSGAEYAGEKRSAGALDIREVELDGSRQHLNRDLFKVEYRETRSQLQELVDHIHAIAEKKHIQRVKSIWMPPLPERIALETLQSAGKPVIGLVDDPAKQRQYPLEIDFVKNGHLAIYGAPSSGKTTLLQTLIVSAAKTYSPEECSIYAIDFGARTLGLLESLPHMGGVVMVDEAEKLKNLIKFLLKEMERRKVAFSDGGVSSYASYRLATGRAMPMAVLAIDNYPALIEVYPDTEEPLIQISREGSNLGVYVVLTANAPGAVKYKLSANIKAAISLQIADRGDYSSIVGRTAGLEPSAPDGRGLVRDNPPLEFQTALPIAGESEADRTGSLRRLFEELNKKWAEVKAVPIPEIPKKLTPEMLAAMEPPAGGGCAVPLGVDFETVAPLVHNFGEDEHLLVAGSARSGKSAFLTSVIDIICRRDSGDVYIFDSRFGALSGVKTLPCVKGYASGQEETEKLLSLLMKEVAQRRKAGKDNKKASAGRDLFMVIDDCHSFAELANSESTGEMESVIKRERGLKFHIVLCGLISDIGSGWEGFVKAMRELQTGVLFAGVNDQQLFNARLPYAEAAKPLKPGEACYICRGSVKKIKTAY